MWQRIQTVFLVIAIISLIATIFFPIWIFVEASGKSHALYALHYTTIENGVKTTTYFPYSVTAILAIAAATVAMVEIRKFKDRLLQMKLGALNSLFMAGTIVSAVLFANQMFKTFHGGDYGLGLWIPGIAVVCNLIANRFIRRDEKLVRDSERLR
jgi:Na+-transporting NADH:ubiquinone oxidoreductase subunit NqrE